MNDLEKWLEENPDFKNYKEMPEPENKKLVKKIAIPEIDLHGCTADKAIVLLTRFIQNQATWVRKLKIIHGKGNHSEQKEPVLKKEVWHWLKRKKEKKEWIKDFSFAANREGGDGVTIVWLI
jgi:DNA-nicking Smr family endonuclease